MGSTFGSIETATRGLRTHQTSLSVTGHNITNADTDGYSRQRAVVETTDPYTEPSLSMTAWAGQVGTGCEVTEIQRLRDDFVDYQIRSALSEEGEWNKRQESLEQLEVVFNEPSDDALGAQITQFWDSIEELAAQPEDTAIRTSMREDALILVETVEDLNYQLTSMQKDLNSEVSVLVERINTLASEIAELNQNIAKVSGSGQSPNDLMDKRELLVQELAGITNISVTTDYVNQYHISIGGSLLVAGDETLELSVQTDPNNKNYFDVIWSANKTEANVYSGELYGTLQMRDEDVQYYIDKIDDFVETLVTEFNAVHEAGFGLNDSTGVPFFVGTNATDFGVHSSILADVSNIAASADVAGVGETPHGATGNGDNALDLAGVLRVDKFMDEGNSTLVEFYNGLISKLGVDAEKANTTSANKTTLVGYLEERQESVAGVNLDEELANMIKFENAYNASSRFLTTFDDLLDQLIRNTGRVGL